MAAAPNVATQELRLLLASALYLQQRVQEEAKVCVLLPTEETVKSGTCGTSYTSIYALHDL